MNTVPDSKTEPTRLPPGQQLVAPGKWPVIGERQPAQPERPARLLVSGELAQSTDFSLAQLLQLKQTIATIDIHCVTRWSKLGVQFTGVRLVDLLGQLDVLPTAKFVSFNSNSSRNHSTSLPLEDACNLDTLIAHTVEGEPINIDHGGPLRNIVPGRYFYKSVKWLQEIELLAEDRLGYWEAESGYHNRADPWREERYMAPTIDRRTAAELIESRNFADRDLRSIDADGRDLAGLNACRALLRDARLNRANLQGADLTEANLSNAHLRQADLRGARLVKTDLEGADLAGADLRGADLTGCSLIGCSFCDLDSHGQPRLGAQFDANTRLPAELLDPLTPAQADFVYRQMDGF